MQIVLRFLLETFIQILSRFFAFQSPDNLNKEEYQSKRKLSNNYWEDPFKVVLLTTQHTILEAMLFQNYDRPRKSLERS